MSENASGSRLVLNEEPFDYVLVFANPFHPTIKSKLAKLLATTYTHDQARHAILSVFKIAEHSSYEDEEPYHQQLRADLQTFLDKQGPEIAYEPLCEFVCEKTTRVMQEHLKLEVHMFYSRDQDEIFVKVRASEENLAVQADLIDYNLQFKSKEHRHEFKRVAPFGPFEKNKDTPSGLHAAFLDNRERHYKRYDEFDIETSDPSGSFFRQIDRIRLVFSIITGVIDISHMQQMKVLLMHFPVHRSHHLDVLKSKWAAVRNTLSRQDLNLVRTYFGEKISLYFAWLQMYVIWLFVPGVIGLIFFIIMMAANDYHDTTTDFTAGEASILIFGVLLAAGSTTFDQLWIRQEKWYAWEWGMFNYSRQETQRPEFDGILGKDPVTGKIKKLRTRSTRWQRVRRTVSYSVVLLFIGLVIASVVGLFLYKQTLHSTWGLRFAAFLNALQIKIMNMIYNRVARYLNDWENHETTTDYNDALSVKLFLFQFVNSYNSLFYIAFIKSSAEGCTDGDCLLELQTQLGVIFVTNLALNVMELGLPFLRSRYNTWSEEKRIKSTMAAHPDRHIRIEMSDTEKQAKLDFYDTPMYDYMELVIQYGYVVLFSASFPLTPLLAYILNIFEVRVDSSKLCWLVRRPFPFGAETIGIWFEIIQVVSYIGCLTNAAIIVFTASVFDTSLRNKWIAFVVIEHFLFGFKYLLAAYIPDKPYLVKKGALWQKRIINEQLYGKLSDVDKERKARNLEFSEIPGVEHIKFDPGQIHEENY